MSGQSAAVEERAHALPWYRLGFHSFAEFTTYVTFVFLGMSIMLVASAVTSAPSFLSQYYVYATGEPDAVAETPLFWNHVNTFYNAGTYAMQVIMELAALTPFMRAIPLSVRLFLGLGIPFLELIVIIAVPAAKIPTQNGAIAVIMVIALFGGFSKALCDSCSNALVGPFPTKFVNGEQWGLAVIALLMSIIQIVLQAGMGTSFNDVMVMSRIYFGICIAIQVISVLLLYLLRFNPYAQKYIAEFRAAAELREQEGREMNGSHSVHEPAAGAITDVPVNAEDKEGAVAGENDADDSDEVRAVHGENFVVKSAAVLQGTGDADRMVDLDQTKNITSTEQMLRASLWSVFKRIYPMLLCAFTVYFATLLVFPGVFFLVPVNSGWYYTVIVALYNAGDFFARVLLMIRPLRPSPMAVIVGTFSRLLVIPLIVVCARGYIKGAALPYVLITIYGLTNGFFGCMACIHCPRTPTLHYAGERSLAGIMAGVFLMFGLCFGSNLSLAITLTF